MIIRFLHCLKNFDLLSLYFNLGVQRFDIIEVFYNKIKTYKLVKKLAIPFPKSIFPKSFVELNEIKINFPVIIKPAIMQEFYDQTKTKVFICDNLDSLKIIMLKHSNIFLPIKLLFKKSLKVEMRINIHVAFMY